MSGYSLLILYLRISVEDMDHNGEDKDESNSIVNQRELLRRYVEDTPELGRYQVMELCDDGYSGTSMERPGMEKLLDMAKKGQVGCILVKDFSRFGRDYLTVSDYVDQIFPFMGIRFISINDNYDSAKCNGATSGVEIAFRNVIYGYYSQDLSVKVRSGKRTKAQSGKFMSPFAPIGYQKAPENRNQLVVEPEGAAIVRRIFRMAGEGMSVMQILRVLNRERIPTPSQLKNRHGEFHKWWVGVGDNKVWDGSIVVNILRDERYLGKNVYGKHYRPVVGDYRTKKSSREEWVIVEDCHEAILSREEFMAAQKILREQEGRNHVPLTTYLFSGKIQCANCQYALHRVKTPTPRYYCITKRRAEDCQCMKGHLKEAELAKVVFAVVRAYMEVFLDRRKLKKRAEDSGYIPSLRKQLAALHSCVKECQEQKARLYEQLADEDISREVFKSRQEALSHRQEEAQANQERLEGELMKLENIISSGRMEEQILENYLGMEELTREMVEAFIDCVSVYDDKSIHIQWRFENGIIFKRFPAGCIRSV